jgi:Tol biopolymer transport system component
MDIRDRDEADIWIYEWARDAMYRLTTHPGQDVSPVWSPDGRWIAFSPRGAISVRRTSIASGRTAPGRSCG